MGLHVGDRSFGYVKGATNKDPLVPVREETAAIAEGFTNRAAGMGYAEIMRTWNGRGLRPHSKRGYGVFTASAVQSILENDFYVGFIHHNGQRRRGAHEPIITEELFLAAQARVRRQPSHAREKRLLADLLVCAPCGGPIWQCKSGTNLNYHYYREASQRQNRDCPSAGKMWRAEDAERIVSEAIVAMTIDDGWIAQIDRDARRLLPTDGQQRKKLEGLRTRYNEAFFAEAMDKTEWKRRIANLNEELARLPVDQPNAVVFAGQRLRSIGQVWSGMTIGERREACQILFESVKMDTATKQLWLQLWPEFQPLFDNRRELCRLGTPGRTRTCAHGLGNHCSIL